MKSSFPLSFSRLEVQENLAILLSHSSIANSYWSLLGPGISILFVLGCLFRVPLFPVHQTKIRSESTASFPAGMILISGNILVGGFLVFQLLFSMIPVVKSNPLSYTSILRYVSLWGAVWFPLLSLNEPHKGKVLCWLALASVSISLMGISTGTATSLSNGLWHLMTTTLGIGLMFVLLQQWRSLQQKWSHSDRNKPHHLMQIAPWSAMAILIVSAELIAIPGTSTFQTRWGILTELYRESRSFAFGNLRSLLPDELELSEADNGSLANASKAG